MEPIEATSFREIVHADIEVEGVRFTPVDGTERQVIHSLHVHNGEEIIHQTGWWDWPEGMAEAVRMRNSGWFRTSEEYEKELWNS